MKITVLPHLFSVCSLKKSPESISEFSFLSITDEEISLLCKTEDVPNNVISREDQWRGCRIEGVLDFSLVGVLADISGILAENNIPIFTVSTYNTDYFFMKNKYCIKAITALKSKGYEI